MPGRCTREAAGSNDNASMAPEFGNLLICFDGDAFNSGEDQDFVLDPDGIDCVRIDEVQVESGIEYLRDHFMSKER